MAKLKIYKDTVRIEETVYSSDVFLPYRKVYRQVPRQVLTLDIADLIHLGACPEGIVYFRKVGLKTVDIHNDGVTDYKRYFKLKSSKSRSYFRWLYQEVTEKDLKVEGLASDLRDKFKELNRLRKGCIFRKAGLYE